MPQPFVILTGASGSGKTALAQSFREHHSDQCDVFSFDSIGVPPMHRMEADYGSGDAWQRAMTLQWIERIRSLLSSSKSILFEGQMRIAFILEALVASDIANAHIILLDCDDAIRTARLHSDRSQPELANPVMMNWAQYLREKALKQGIEILDTGATSFDSCIVYLSEYLGITKATTNQNHQYP